MGRPQAGPEGGAYAEVLRALEARADRAGVLVEGMSSEGSLGNLRLLDAGTARDADLLVHEATYTSDMADEAVERGHSTAAEAARVARDAGVRHLLITHFSPRYEDSEPLLAEARAVFPNTTAARDLLEVEVPAAERLEPQAK